MPAQAVAREMDRSARARHGRAMAQGRGAFGSRADRARRQSKGVAAVLAALASCTACSCWFARLAFTHGGSARAGVVERLAPRPSVRLQALGDESEPLRVGASTVPQKIAKTVVGCLSTGGYALAQSSGPSALYNVVKAAIFAGSDVASKYDGQRMGLVFDYLYEDGEKAGGNYTGIVSRYRLVSAPSKVPPEGRAEIRCTTSTNIGKAAGSIKARLEKDGVAVLTGTGKEAVDKAVKSVLLAQKYMAVDGRPGNIAVLPLQVETEWQLPGDRVPENATSDEAGKKWFLTQLTCVLI